MLLSILQYSSMLQTCDCKSLHSDIGTVPCSPVHRSGMGILYYIVYLHKLHKIFLLDMLLSNKMNIKSHHARVVQIFVHSVHIK